MPFPKKSEREGGTPVPSDVPDLGSTRSPAPPKGYRAILVALDRTGNDGMILRALPRLVSPNLAQLTGIHVVLTRTTERSDSEDGLPANEDEQRVQSALRRTLQDSLAESHAPITIRILHGDPAERISEYAEHVNCDLIVVGSHRRGPLGRLLKGSVASRVVASSRRSVLVIKEPPPSERSPPRGSPDV